MTSSRGLRAQVESLLADELWDSAETLGGLLASHAQSRHADAEGVPAGERAACVALFADALLGKREHRRALHHYARALELNRLAPPAGGQTEAETPTPMGTRPPGTPGPDGSPAAPAPVTPGGAAALATQETPTTRSGTARSGAVPDATHLDESSTKFKMGKCFAALREWRFALAELETIPARARTLPVTLALAEAYKRTGYDRASVACYKECLRINPFAVEAVEALADAGAAPAEPEENATETSGGADFSDARDALATETLRLLTRGRVALASGDAPTAASVYAALAETFPGEGLGECRVDGRGGRRVPGRERDAAPREKSQRLRGERVSGVRKVRAAGRFRRVFFGLGGRGAGVGERLHRLHRERVDPQTLLVARDGGSVVARALVRLSQRKGHGKRPRARGDGLQLGERETPLPERGETLAHLELGGGLVQVRRVRNRARSRRSRARRRRLLRRERSGAPGRHGGWRRGRAVGTGRARRPGAHRRRGLRLGLSARGRGEAVQLQRARVVVQRPPVLALAEQRVREERDARGSLARGHALGVGVPRLRVGG